MTDTEKLTEILNKVHLHGASEQEGYVDTDSLSPSEARSVILDWAKSLLPEEKELQFNDALAGRQALRNIGWNRCRSQLLANIERLRRL